MNLSPMLAEHCEPALVDQFLASSDYYAEQKLDGHRVLIHIEGDRLTPLSRRGLHIELPRTVLEAFEPFTGRWVFDGELVNGTLYLFDLPVAGDLIDPATEYEVRRRALAEFHARWNPHPSVQLVDCAQTVADKQRLIATLEDHGCEGVMLKRRDGRYASGKRTVAILKHKFQKTADCIVTELGWQGKDNAVLSLFENGTLVEVGKCSMLGKPRVAVGDVAEIRYLYATNDRRLYQPNFLRRRDDKPASDCTVDQLLYTSKEVVRL